jgi:hypothetical protein
MREPILEDFDPSFDLLQISDWLLRAAKYAEFKLKNHPKTEEFCDELRSGAVSIANANGQLVGAIQALTPVCELFEEARTRQNVLREEYSRFRAQVIEKICKLYLQADSMRKDVNNGPGKPRRKLPDFERFKEKGDMSKIKEFVQDSWEWKLAVDLAEVKHKTERYAGLNAMMTEAISAGNLDDIGDTEQRIKRLAMQIHSDRDLYLTPGLRAARAGAPLFRYSGDK